MASASAPVDQRNQGNSQKSHFQQTVCLVDWWLVKAENGAQRRGLAVAGFSSREKQAVRVFSSSPILTRYDVFTLETTDGICVILNGLINKDCTVGNGFPSHVCDYFSFGFPPYWKEYYDKFLVEDGQMPADSHEKDFGSQGRNKTKDIHENKNAETKIKFAHVTKKTPDAKKKRVPSASPESMSINRSRSGRLLMPTLEFWRNQRAVYDADRTVTGIEEGINEQPRIILIESGSAPKKKRRNQQST
ncbi:hypothetical protein ACS0TY_029816 [Phlomoides rotata]